MSEPQQQFEDGAVESVYEASEQDATPVNGADVESAGRSCLVILALGIVILAILLGWIVLRSTSGGT